MSCINSIHLDVTETVKAFYPSLTDQQAETEGWLELTNSHPRPSSCTPLWVVQSPLLLVMT